MAFRDFVPLYASVDALAASPQRTSSTGLPILRHMPPLLPRKITQTHSVVFVWMRRPSPYVHRVGIFNLTFEATSGFTRVTACGFASGNPRPLITQTPLPLATGVHGQFPGRDFNPLDTTVVTANGRPYIIATRAFSSPGTTFYAWILSAGPDGQFQTDDENTTVRNGDDIGKWIYH